MAETVKWQIRKWQAQALQSVVAATLKSHKLRPIQTDNITSMGVAINALLDSGVSIADAASAFGRDKNYVKVCRSQARKRIRDKEAASTVIVEPPLQGSLPPPSPKPAKPTKSTKQQRKEYDDDDALGFLQAERDREMRRTDIALQLAHERGNPIDFIFIQDEEIYALDDVEQERLLAAFIKRSQEAEAIHCASRPWAWSRTASELEVARCKFGAILGADHPSFKVFPHKHILG